MQKGFERDDIIPSKEHLLFMRGVELIYVVFIMHDCLFLNRTDQYETRQGHLFIPV